jgi:dTMP kinase
MRGRLIAFEGIDGAGTTTQSTRLVEALDRRGRPAHLTREPSTGPIGMFLRRVLQGDERVPPPSVALLFAADRIDHLVREIEPQLAAGRIVVTDRYVMSSLAYQSLTIERDDVAAFNRRAPVADLTFFIDVPVATAAERRAKRGGKPELFDENRVQERVAGAYLAEVERAQRAGERVRIIDGSAPADAVEAAIWLEVVPWLGF